MNKKLLPLGALLLLCLISSGPASAPLSTAHTLRQPHPLPFEQLSLHIEIDLPSIWSPGHVNDPPLRSYLDFPAEVVLVASAPRGFGRLRVLNSARETVFDLDLRREAACGLSEIELESEGATLRDVLQDYPGGEYLVQAVTVDGVPLEGVVTLTPQFPGFFAALAPSPDEMVPFGDVTIAWTPSRGAVVYELEIEQEELGFGFTIELPASQTSFQLPVQILQPGRAYEYSLAVKGDTDNELEVEGGFRTADWSR